MFKGLQPILYAGKEVWPLIEGGKGVSATNHASSGAWAAAGGIGTVSAVNADSYDPEGRIIPQIYEGLTRRERHEELIRFAVDGAVAQVQRAYDMAGGKGAININVLWEMGGAQRVLHGVLERTKGLVSGVTCGAGMPYKLSEIAASYGVNYLPIISSARAFSALWKRAYHKAAEWLAAVVYEDPWLAGGHNGLSNAEDPRKPQDPYPRVKALRDTMRDNGHRRQRSDRHGRRRLAARRVGELDRQSRTRAGRVPVRHPTAADPGKPDPARVEGAADEPRGGRRAPAPLLADRLLFVGGAQSRSFAISRRAATARSPSPRKRSASIISNSTSASAPRRITG